MDLEPP